MSGAIYWSMAYITGGTIYEHVISVDQNNAPVSGATFDSVVYKDGVEYALPISVTLYDEVRAIFNVSLSPDVAGTYQFYMKNNDTSVIFVSDTFTVSNTGDVTNIYVGL